MNIIKIIIGIGLLKKEKMKVLIIEIMLSQELGAQMEQLIFGMSLIQPKFVKLTVFKLTLEL